MMQQPKPVAAIEELRVFLSFAVPLRAAEMGHDFKRWRFSDSEVVKWLTGECVRAGVSVGVSGDVLQFRNGRPRVGRAQSRVTLTASDLVSGVAAAALLAQLQGETGIVALGDFYGVTEAGPSPASEARMPHGRSDWIRAAPAEGTSEGLG